jgi:hypothetical protein
MHSSWDALLPTQSPAGFRILVPGYAQWSWRQRERGLALFGSFVAALAVGAFAWGTWTGTAVLGFAFLAHVVSVVDVLRQSAFPGFGRWMPVASASGGLALGVYAPVLAVVSLLAWPVPGSGSPAEGYLVNCWAYRQSEPRHGDWVWVRTSPEDAPRIGRVVAGSGEEVEWSARLLRVNGRPLALVAPFRTMGPPDELRFTVPTGYVLVNPIPAPPGGATSEGLALMARDQIEGRAWARSYPLWSRRLLP